MRSKAMVLVFWMLSFKPAFVLSSFTFIKTFFSSSSFSAIRVVHFSSVQLFSRVWLFVNPWTAACQAHCPSPTPRVYSNSCPLSRWCHPTISSSVISFSSCLQSFPASGSFLASQFFASGGQSIGVSASAWVLPINIQDWFPRSPRDSQEFSPTPKFKSINSSALSDLYSPTLISIHDYWKNCNFN